MITLRDHTISTTPVEPKELPELLIEINTWFKLTKLLSSILMVREFNWVSTGHLLPDAPQARSLLMSGIAMTTPRDHTTLITLAEPKELPEPPIETNIGSNGYQ